jgi:hypothetical protein
VPFAGGEPVRPPNPTRYRNLIYGFALAAQDEAIELAGGKV